MPMLIHSHCRLSEERRGTGGRQWRRRNLRGWYWGAVGDFVFEAKTQFAVIFKERFSLA